MTSVTASTVAANRSFAPERVVSLQPSATVILAQLGLLDRVVACTKYCRDVCAEVAGKAAIVADSWSAQAQQIMAARPDLVIAAVPYQVEAVAEILKAGVRFLGLAPRTLADIYTDIATIAGVMQAPARGEEIIAAMRASVAEACSRNTRAERPHVFCEEWGKPIIRSQPWVAELVHAAGGEFLGEPGKHTDADWVRSSQPDVILMAWCGAGGRVPLEKVVRERGWTDLPAVRNHRVFCISDELLNTPAPTLVDGRRALEAAISGGELPKGMRKIE